MSPMNKSLLKKIMTGLSAIALTALAAPAFAADFTVIDTNADGQIDFAEYRAIAKTEGKTVTLAAQEFTKMSQGDAIVTADEFALAMAMLDQPVTDAPYVAAPLPVETVDNVNTYTETPTLAEPITSEPVISEPIISEPVVTETPIMIDPAVAGEVEMTDETWTKTPMEEGSADVLDIETPEIETPEIETPEVELPDTDSDVLEPMELEPVTPVDE